MGESSQTTLFSIATVSDDSLVLEENVSNTRSTDSDAVPEVTSTFSDDFQAELQYEGGATQVSTTKAGIADDTASTTADNEDEGVQSREFGNEDSDVNEAPKGQKVGAGIAVGIVTAPLVGPILAVVAGVAAAYGTTKGGVAGDACRAAGDIAIHAKEKALEMDKKHSIMNKTKQSANHLIIKAQKTNDKHKMMENFKKFMALTFKNIALALQLAKEKMKQGRNKTRARRTSAATHKSYSEDSSYSFKPVAVQVQAN